MSHPYDLMLRCLVRGIALLSFDARTEIPEWTTGGRVEEALEVRGRLAAGRGKAVLEELPAALDAMTPILPPAGSEITGDASIVHHRRALLNVLWAICRITAWSPELAVRLIDELAANELHVDPWERHRIMTAMTFYSHNAR